MYIILHIVPCEYKGKKIHLLIARWCIIQGGTLLYTFDLQRSYSDYISLCLGHIWSDGRAPAVKFGNTTNINTNTTNINTNTTMPCQHYKHQYSDVNVLPMAASAVWWLEHTVMAGIEHLSLQRAQTIEHCLFHLKLEMILAPILVLALSAGAPCLDWLADRNLWLISLDKPRCGSRWRR